MLPETFMLTQILVIESHFSSMMEYLLLPLISLRCFKFNRLLASEGSNVYSTTIKTHIKGTFSLLWAILELTDDFLLFVQNTEIIQRMWSDTNSDRQTHC